MGSAGVGSAAPSAFTIVPCAAAVRYFRMLSSGLWTAGASDQCGAALAESHFGLQAQDPEAVLLAIFNRQRRTASSRVRLRARYQVASDLTVRAWGQRGTLHMYSVGDFPFSMGASRQRLIDQTNSRLDNYNDGARPLSDAVTAELTQKLADGDEVTTAIVNPIAERLKANGDAVSKARRYPFIHACEKGLATRVTREGDGRGRLLTLAPWTGPWRDVPQNEALRLAARRYFAAYAPAREQDFRYWMNVMAKHSVEVVRHLDETGELVPVPDFADDDVEWLVAAGDAQKMLAECAANVPPREEWPVRLLGRFDPYLLAHKVKTWLGGKAAVKRVWTNNADIVPTVIVYGRIRGKWSCERKKKSAKVMVTLFAQETDEDTPLTEREMHLVEEEAQRIMAEFWEIPTCKVQFVSEPSKFGVNKTKGSKECEPEEKRSQEQSSGNAEQEGGRRRSKRLRKV